MTVSNGAPARFSPQETLARFRQVASRMSTPPAPRDSRIVEGVVHGEDIRQPLGFTRSYPRGGRVRALRLQAQTPGSFGGAQEHVAPLRLTAVDAGVSIGDGLEVSGSALSLLLSVFGRRVELRNLGGPGVGARAEAI